MAKCYLVKPKKIKLPLDLEGEEWVEVWDKLSHVKKESYAMAAFQRVYGLGAADASIDIDWSAHGLARALAWCTDWSFVDEDNNLLEFNKENLEQISDEAFEAITKALDAHIGKIEGQKKAPGVAPEPSAT
jgi:hypothetical protein